MKIRSRCWLVVLFAAPLLARAAGPAPALPPDNRFKADILLVVAHPDDETGVSAYLAKVLDEHKRVEVLYLTRGEAGHNNMGPERAAALGAAREMEVRHALATLGIDNVWFLDGLDTPSQNVLQSLARWHHGQNLEEVVRMVRFTRPEVVLTWLPGFFIGENHGDHQAAGVLATEAFDLAGDPAIFPAQLAAPVKVNETLLEGLQPWQPKKIYYFSDASNQEQFKNTGPVYSVADLSPSRNLPYWQLAMNAFSFHLTQYRTYIEGLGRKSAAEQQSDWGDPVQLTFGKSKVEISRTGDVFEGIGTVPVAFVPPAPPAVAPLHPFELAGPWGFYQVFHQQHGLTDLPHAAIPEIAITRGADLQVPLTLRNTSTSAQTFSLSVSAPKTWTVQEYTPIVSLQPGEVVPLLVTMNSPTTDEKTTQQITCRAESGGQTVGVVELHVKLRSGGLPQ